MVGKLCPYCAGPLGVYPSLDVDLVTDTAVADGVVYKLGASAAEALWLLADRHPATATYTQFSAALWGTATGPGDEIGVVRTYMSQLRSTLRPSAWRIVSVFRQGFFLERTNRTAFRCYCGAALNPHRFEAYVDKNSILVAGSIRRVGPTIIKLFAALLALPEGGALSARQLEAQLYGEDLRRGVKQVEVMMCALRAVLKDTPWRIKVRWRQGYYIEKGDKG